MKELEFLDALGGIDETYIQEAAECGVSPGKRILRWGALAACLCLAVLLVYLVGTEVFRSRKSLVGYATASSLSRTPAPAIPESAESSPLLEASGRETAPSPAVAAESEASSPEGVFLPALELPEGDAAAACMVPLVVYNGSVYTDAASWRGEEARALDALTGDYLGEAVGIIDPWSEEEAWEQEFAGTVSGPLYTVKGYDTDFRICLRQEYTDEAGEPGLWILYLERLNGITLTTGADLFEDRLHLRDRITEIRWQDHDDWNYGRGNFRDAALDGETRDAFLEALDRGEFVRHRSGYSSEHQAHLFLDLEDGLTVHLRLLAEGYVAYGVLNGVLLKMPGEVFDAVYEACGGT